MFDDYEYWRYIEPAKYQTAEDFLEKVKEYFQNPEKNMKKQRIVTKEGNTLEVPRPTITGLALFLGFADKRSFYDYEKREKFTYVAKKARALIEQEYEMLLHTNPSAAIFALKQFGWTDKQDINQNLGGQKDNPVQVVDFANIQNTLIKQPKEDTEE